MSSVMEKQVICHYNYDIAVFIFKKKPRFSQCVIVYLHDTFIEK